MSTPAVHSPNGESTRRQNIFDIGIELEKIFDAYDQLCSPTEGPSEEAESFLRAALESYFEKISDDLDRKVDAYCAVVKTYEARANIRREEARRLTSLATTDENNAKRLRDRLKQFMEFSGNAKLETPLHKVWVQNNGGVLPIEWPNGVEPDPETLPSAYVIVKKVIDVEAVRSDLEGAIDLPFATLGSRGTHLRIK